jgi:starch synthase
MVTPRVLFVSSEIFPLAKTGGLADVSAALPSALADLGVDIRLVLPAYAGVLDRVTNLSSDAVCMRNFPGVGEVRLATARLPDSGLPLWLVICPSLFGREGGLYRDRAGQDWPDNALRFATMNHAAWRIATGEADPGWQPDVIHANDWHAGLLPLFAASQPAPRPRTVFTIHNMAFQGLFPYGTGAALGLSRAEDATSMEFFGNISFLKAGIAHADRLTTVSPTYAREILTPEYGCGLEGLLQQRAGDLTGILNGADYGVWDPADDPHLPCGYSYSDISGKRICKSLVQKELGLDVEPERPLLAFLSRITHQKMADVVIDALPQILDLGAQFALVGEGDPALEQEFLKLSSRYPGRLAVRLGYDEAVAHRLQAGADMLLHPSRFEPCGLLPIYAMRYGALPIVRHVGGPVDTVSDAEPGAVGRSLATGFVFNEPTVTEMCACLARAMAMYRQPLSWRRLQLVAMQQDFGWSRSAEKYLAVYQSLMEGRPEEPHSAEARKKVRAGA